MDYLLYDIDTRLQASLPALEGGQRIERDYRSSSFHGSTDQALVLYYLPPGCLKLLDPRRDAQIPQKPKYLSDAMPLCARSSSYRTRGTRPTGAALFW